MVGTGTWRAKAVEAYPSETKNGTEQVCLHLKAVGGPFDGGQIVYYGFLTEKTIDRTVESLRILQWKGDDLSDLSSVIGHECEIVVEEEEYNGKVTCKVRWINRVGGGGGAPRIEPAKAKAVGARLKDRVQAADRAIAAAAANGSGAKAPF